jgi:hypothetical protein
MKEILSFQKERLVGAVGIEPTTLIFLINQWIASARGPE